jgi:hypothetical protein
MLLCKQNRLKASEPRNIRRIPHICAGRRGFDDMLAKQNFHNIVIDILNHDMLFKPNGVSPSFN